MKLTKGTTKVIVSSLEAAEENQARAQVGGKIFVPVYTVYEWDPDTKTLEVRKAHSYHASTLVPRTNRQSMFPHKWAPSALRDCVLWLETSGEVTLQLTDEVSNG